MQLAPQLAGCWEGYCCDGLRNSSGLLTWLFGLPVDSDGGQ